MPQNFSITFLGTFAASMSFNDSTSAYLIIIGQSRILIDAGIGALRQLRKAKINPDDINIILLTHWHIDHYAGLPAVLQARAKSNPISVYAPVIPLSARIYMTGLFCPPSKSFGVINKDFFLDFPDYHLQALSNSHGIDSYGWAITGKSNNKLYADRKIVISGDTRPAETILNAARGADLLVHEATYLNKDANMAYTHQHSTAVEAAGLAVKARVGALALTHIPKRISWLEVQLEARKIFPGTIIPFPLDTIHL